MSRLSIAGVALAVLAMLALVVGAPLAVPPLVALAGLTCGCVGHRRTMAREEELERERRAERLAAAAWRDRDVEVLADWARRPRRP